MTDMLEHDGGIEGQLEGQPIRVEPEASDVEEEVAMVRELVFKAHPDVVRELLVGETLAEILASVGPARAAYQRIAERVEEELNRERLTAAPAGSGRVTTPVPDQATLTTTQRLRLGLRARAGTPH